LALGARDTAVDELKQGDTNSKIAAMVKLITKYGPQINRIARELGVHKETVRYWHKKLLRSGYTAQAVPNYERLGLRRVAVVAEFSEEFRSYADAILVAMGELCYLTSFAKTLPEDLYSIQASVPQEHTSDWIRFMYELKKRGVFRTIQAFPFEWVRIAPMHSELYDFEAGSWQFDWKSKPDINSASINFNPSTRGPFDFTDLNIIKHMQLNPDASLIEAQKKLGVNYKTLSWHYRTHLKANGLLKGYLVNWPGGRYDPRLEKALHRRHRYLWIELLVSGVTESERMELMAKVNRLPFVWAEAGGGQNYLAQIAFPMETMAEALQFIKEVVAPVRWKATFHFLDQTNALRFTIAPKLYNPAAKKWMFDEVELLTRFNELVLQIKGATS